MGIEMDVVGCLPAGIAHALVCWQSPRPTKEAKDVRPLQHSLSYNGGKAYAPILTVEIDGKSPEIFLQNVFLSNK